MKITAVRCAVLGGSPVVRIVTDEGISGYGQVETSKPYVNVTVPLYERNIVGEDPTDVERVMLKIRRLGAFKPWGAVVSAIEMALWDTAGKALGVAGHKLLGGKVRDRVRIYNGGVRPKPTASEEESYFFGSRTSDYSDCAAFMKEASEGFTIVKMPIGFHGPMATEVPDFFYGDRRTGSYYPTRGHLTERGLAHMVECVSAAKEALGDSIGLALDCGPGWTVSDAVKFARAVEPFNLMWLEDLLTGDYTPYVAPDLYRDVTESTTTPIHTGEQIYLRQNFAELIERRAVRVVGPDPADVGGIAELKWISELADLHSVGMAPHGLLDGLFGLAAHVQVGATMPDNYIAFEYPVARPEWWYDIVTGLPDPIVRDGFIDVWDRPGLGVDFDVQAARSYLSEEDRGFFD